MQKQWITILVLGACTNVVPQDSAGPMSENNIIPVGPCDEVTFETYCMIPNRIVCRDGRTAGELCPEDTECRVFGDRGEGFGARCVPRDDRTVSCTRGCGGTDELGVCTESEPGYVAWCDADEEGGSVTCIARCSGALVCGYGYDQDDNPVADCVDETYWEEPECAEDSCDP
jgi:hypothetical protein